MFITFACLTLGIITLITLRDWVHYARSSSRSIQKSLKRISQHISLKEWDQALKELTPLLENERGGKEALLFEIQVLRGTGRGEEGLAKIKEATLHYPEERLFRLEEGLILLQLGNPQEALAALQACVPILRGESDLLAYAEALLHSGKAQECLDVLKPHLEDAQSGRLAALAADALYELKNFQHAINWYHHALSTGCATHRVFNQLGHAYRRLGNLAEAEKIFRRLLDKDSSDIEAILGIGACLQERGHYTKAFLVYQTGLSWSRDLRLLNKAAYTALRTKRYRQSEAYFCEIAQRQEADPQTLAYYGLSLESQKKWQEAEQTYLKIIELFPSCHHGYRALAWMFGVGLCQTVTQEQGLNFAHRALKLQNDPISWKS